MEIKEKKFKVILKTNSTSNEIISYDDVKKICKIKLKLRPIGGKANQELKKPVRISSRFTSEEKIIEVLL